MAQPSALALTLPWPCPCLGTLAHPLPTLPDPRIGFRIPPRSDGRRREEEKTEKKRRERGGRGRHFFLLPSCLPKHSILYLGTVVALREAHWEPTMPACQPAFPIEQGCAQGRKRLQVNLLVVLVLLILPNPAGGWILPGWWRAWDMLPRRGGLRRKEGPGSGQAGDCW